MIETRLRSKRMRERFAGRHAFKAAVTLLRAFSLPPLLISHATNYFLSLFAPACIARIYCLVYIAYFFSPLHCKCVTCIYDILSWSVCNGPWRDALPVLNVLQVVLTLSLKQWFQITAAIKWLHTCTLLSLRCGEHGLLWTHCVLMLFGVFQTL